MDAELNAEAGHVTVNDNMEVHAEAEVDAHAADEDTEVHADDDMEMHARKRTSRPCYRRRRHGHRPPILRPSLSAVCYMMIIDFALLKMIFRFYPSNSLFQSLCYYYYFACTDRVNKRKRGWYNVDGQCCIYTMICFFLCVHIRSHGSSVKWLSRQKNKKLIPMAVT